MKWLSKAARLMSLEQLLGGDLEDPLQVAITFDDGYASVHDVALPILKDVGTVATVFPNTGIIAEGGRNSSDAALGYYPNESFLSWRDVEGLATERWSVGSHGVGHLDLAAACEETASRELTASKKMIENVISVPCMLFAYTWGKHTPCLRRLVAEAGYRYAFSGRHEPLQADGDPFTVPRINISNDYTMSDFKAVISGDWDYLGWIQRMKAGL
jgi:peptidoglycan/xylan/chitin deacetylase (PgdA/CDA1 family)